MSYRIGCMLSRDSFAVKAKEGMSSKKGCLRGGFWAPAVGQCPWRFPGEGVSQLLGNHT